MLRLLDLCREMIRIRGQGAKFVWNGTELPASIAAEDLLSVFLKQAHRTVRMVCPGHERTLNFLPGRQGNESLRFTRRASPGIWLPALLDALECAAETPSERAAREMQNKAMAATAAIGENMPGKFPDEPAQVPAFYLERIDPPRPRLRGDGRSAKPGCLAEPSFAVLDCFPEAEAFQQAPSASPGGGKR